VYSDSDLDVTLLPLSIRHAKHTRVYNLNPLRISLAQACLKKRFWRTVEKHDDS